MYLVYKLVFDPEKADAEILIALLATNGFAGFQEYQAGEGELPGGDDTREVATDQSLFRIDAYLPMVSQQAGEAYLQLLQTSYPFTYTVEELPDKNWNAEWEANFNPLRIGGWLGIRAAFHDPMPELAMELLIDPKMAFGTGHHATTHMMCELMRELDWSDRAVFDYGCGTGILAILAKKLSAKYVAAIDIEQPSYENTLENATINGVKLDYVAQSDLANFLSDFKQSEGVGIAHQVRFDCILANINRNVILASLEPLQECLLPHGKLLVSGILESDATLVLEAAATANLRPVRQQQREDWMAWVFESAS